MHMADALLSPAVSATMWLSAAGLTAYASRRLPTQLEEDRVPLMGVLGAFVFAAQMLNFSIPGTGSSGHLVGAILLAALLGPCAAFLVMVSVLSIQAFFFADGGLLALGCNIFNMAFLPCFIAYPLVYRPLADKHLSLAAVLSAVIALQLGALAVVLETSLSGISALPLAAFLALMQPIHLAIGLIEGLITAAILAFIRRAEPGLLGQKSGALPSRGRSAFTPVLIVFAVLAFCSAGFFVWFASSSPDGLEWSIEKLTGQTELPPPEGIHAVIARLQESSAFFANYTLPAAAANVDAESVKQNNAWPNVESSVSIAGIAGALITLFVSTLLGKSLRAYHAAAKRS
ncbi:energy-coupling factor ABC transporter permease [Azotosporobacter soli]|uniref:energy-coupling factor ABC transporter permease n=1 Tax=Azotosporobacter soli TaxID=3055040 RepID=UPI0031FEC4C4